MCGETHPRLAWRYVSVRVSFFMFSNFYLLDVHNKMRVALANLQCFICKNRSSPNLVIIIGSACTLIPWIGFEGPLIVFTIDCRLLMNTYWCSPISFEHVSLWCLLSDTHGTTYQSNLGVQSRKGATWDHLPFTVQASWMFFISIFIASEKSIHPLICRHDTGQCWISPTNCR